MDSKEDNRRIALAFSGLTVESVGMESLACPVCLDLPSGEVHQCLEGHCLCVRCWNRLDPHRCPECRDWLPHKNRNRDREARIAALAATCDHCGVTTTRGAMAEHLRTCKLRPATCSAATAGWKEMAAEQAWPAASDEEVGWRRERVWGPAEDDAPPSDAAVAVMMMSEATAALQKHLMVARVAEKACEQIRRLSNGMIADSGKLPESMVRARSLCVCAMDAVVEAMRAHLQVAAVQQEGCRTLNFLTRRVGPESATESGTVEAVLDAMRAHLQVAQVLRYGAGALLQSTSASDTAVLRVAEAGGLQLMVAAMRTHPQALEVQQRSVVVLYYCRGLFRPYYWGYFRGHATGAISAAMQAFDEGDGTRAYAVLVLNCLKGLDPSNVPRRGNA